MGQAMLEPFLDDSSSIVTDRQYERGVGKSSQFSVAVPDDPSAVKCVACYHHCVLEPGHRGICGIRHNHKGTLYTLVDTVPYSTALDPIEKKPLYHFYPGTKIYSIGTAGCNMRCSFCQNWHMSQTGKGSALDLEEVVSQLQPGERRQGFLTPEEAVRRAAEQGCNSIAYTYNEPTIFADFIYDTARHAHSRGIKNVLVTNGYQSLEFIQKVGPFIDACNIDLKTIRNGFYSRLCGVRIQPVLRNIRIWRALGVWVEVTTLLVPDENDSEEELGELVDYLVELDPAIVWHVSAYHDAFRMRGKGRTPVSTLRRAHRIGKAKGLKYIYLGNVSGDDAATTRCPSCSHILLAHPPSGVWHRHFKGMNKKTGACANCGEVVPGVWTDRCVNFYMPSFGRTNEIPSEMTEVAILVNLSPSSSVRILFATQTGVSEEYAKALAAEGLARGVEGVQVVDMEQYNEAHLLPKENVVVIVLSTFFYGRIPRNGERFMQFLRSSAAIEGEEGGEGSDSSSGILSGVTYALFGIGSTGTKPEHLETYQVIAREVDELMKKLGANELCVMGEGNKKDRFGQTLEEWKGVFWDSYSARGDGDE